MTRQGKPGHPVFVAMSPKTGLHLRKATAKERAAYLRENAKRPLTRRGSVLVGKVLIDEDFGPGASHIPGRFLRGDKTRRRSHRDPSSIYMSIQERKKREIEDLLSSHKKVIEYGEGQGHSKILFEYGAIPNAKQNRGGFMPIVWESGRATGNTYGRGYDLEDAIKIAYEEAKEDARKFIGDWHILIRPRKGTVGDRRASRAKRGKRSSCDFSRQKIGPSHRVWDWTGRPATLAFYRYQNGATLAEITLRYGASAGQEKTWTYMTKKTSPMPTLIAAMKKDGWKTTQGSPASLVHAADGVHAYDSRDTLKPCPVGTQIQTVVLDRHYFTLREASNWIRRHGFHARKVDTTSHAYRFRQHPPTSFREGSFRTLSLRPGVQSVIGCPASSKEHDPNKKFVRVPITRIVLHEGGPGKRRGFRTPWVALVYDEQGHLRSRVSDMDRGYVERKLREFWPDVPVELVSKK